LDIPMGADLEAMAGVDITSVDPDSLVDIRDTVVDKSLPKEERMLDFIRQIKNPYCFRCGKVVVKIGFSDTDATFEDKFENFLRSL